MAIDTPKPPPSLYVFGHLEMGDCLVLNGLIRVLARQNERVKWVVKTDYINAVRATVADLQNVQVLASKGYDEVKNRWIPQCRDSACLKLGYFCEKGFDESKWDSEFYRQAGISFDARWTECRFPSKLLTPQPEKRSVALVHEDEERKFFIKPEFLPSDLEILRITRRASILDWLPDMFSSKELHFIDSAFLNLAESLWAVGALTNTDMIFHQYVKYYPGKARWPELRGPWRVFQ